MTEFLFPSQQQQQILKVNPIKAEKRRVFDKAALDCIITDGRSFGDLRRQGMSKFLNVIYPG